MREGLKQIGPATIATVREVSIQDRTDKAEITHSTSLARGARVLTSCAKSRSSFCPSSGGARTAFLTCSNVAGRRPPRWEHSPENLSQNGQEDATGQENEPVTAMRSRLKIMCPKPYKSRAFPLHSLTSDDPPWLVDIQVAPTSARHRMLADVQAPCAV